MRKILLPVIILLVAVLVGFMVYSKVINPPKPPKLKINGTTYYLQKGFTINMAGGQYATLSVALLLPPTQAIGVTSATDPPPTGIGSLSDEAQIRAIITNDVTDQPESALITPKGRAKLEATILSNIRSQTDTKVTAIYFTDLAVQ